MSTFNGLDMLKIDIANCFGLDKVSWIDRLLWTESKKDTLSHYIDDAENKMLYLKAIHAYQATLRGVPSGHNMFLDATASGLQIMAALSGCKKTARHVNMINTGKREDVYTEVATLMNKQVSVEHKVTRDLIKKPVMTHYYNKFNQDTLNDVQQEAFYTVLAHSFEGAEAVKDTINDYWNPNATEHVWTLPDGHVSRVKVTEMINARIEVDELDHTTFTYRFEVNRASDVSTSLVPNIIHSIDAWIARDMVRQAHKEGFELAHIHDAFCAHPNHMQRVREMYKGFMADLADMSLLESILSEISGKAVSLTKFSDDLSIDIIDSEYMLS